MPEVVTYLSDDWLHQADAGLAGLTPLTKAISVGVNVVNGPADDRQYRLVLGPERVGVEAGIEGANVSMTMSWDVAAAVAQGQMSAQRAFLDGRIQLGGDTSVLLGHQQELTDIDDRLVELRARTTYR